jgi:adhesin transport system outer membrane protein
MGQFRKLEIVPPEITSSKMSKQQTSARQARIGQSQGAVLSACLLAGVVALSLAGANGAWAQSVATQPTQVAASSSLLTLDDLLQMAVEVHPSIVARQAAVGEARATLDAARLQRWPTPSIQTTQGQGTGGGRTTALGLQQPLWTGGRLTAEIDSALARTRSANMAVIEAQQSLGFTVVGTYQSFLQARGRGVALGRFLTRLDQYRASMQRRVDSGASAAVELELIAARQSSTEGQRNAARFAEVAAVAQLTELTGQQLSTDRIAVVLDPPVLPGLDDLLERAQMYSPTLRRFGRDVEQAQSDADAKAAAKWPTVALVAQRNLVHGVPYTVSSSTVGLQLQYVPGAGFSTLAAARAAAAQTESVRATREAARSELITKLHAEYQDLGSALARRLDMMANIKANAAVLASYERLFVAGKRSWLEVMNAAREVSDSELALADIEAQMIAGRYRLALYAAEPQWMEVSQ